MKKIMSIACLAILTISAAAQEDLNVLSQWSCFTDIENSLYHFYADLAFESLKSRKTKVEALQSKADWQDRQQRIKKDLQHVVGQFPSKTPLKPKITGIVERPEFRVEKVVFESQPNFFVTACLFIPHNLKTPAPAVIYCSGHSADAFRSETYQNVCINLTLKGFIVLAFDPIGQGERLQYLDPSTGQSAVGSPTKEHSYAGAQCFMSNSTVAKHMIWDGIRCVDYLLTRPEVDANRIGITGRSGGGTQSSYIAAFDERIHASAPECYITNFTRLIEYRGPQDAEQNFRRGIATGLDHADLIEVRAPKPTLLIGTTRDFFNIQGLQETYAEAQSIFNILGKPKNLSIAIDDSVHASTQNNREALYAFFQKHLSLPGNAAESKTKVFAKEELFVTHTGQVGSSLKGETIFSLNKKEATDLIENLTERRTKKTHILDVQKQADKMLPSTLSPVIFTGRYRRSSYTIEKFYIDKNKYVIPFVIIKPAGDKTINPLLWLSENGKETISSNWSTVKSLVDNGWSVIAPDLIGVGECGPGVFRGDAHTFKQGIGAYNIWFFGIQMGRPIVRLRAEDILELAAHIRTREDVSDKPIAAMADGILCPALQLAAAAQKNIAPVVLINPLISYRSIIENEYYKPELMHGVDPFALPEYDLSDLNAAIIPRGLHIISPVDQQGNVMEQQKLVKSFEYEKKRAEEKKTEFKLMIPETSSQIFEQVITVLGAVE